VEKGDSEFLVVDAANPLPASACLKMVDGRFDFSAAPALADRVRGSRIQMELKNDHFLTRELELPSRASDFLEGIVRTQIDRLTPWHAADAVFGWSEPIEAGPNRMVVRVVAAERTAIDPYLKTVETLGVHSVTAFTTPSDMEEGIAPIKIWEQQTGFDHNRIRKVAVIVLAIIVAVCAATVGGSSIVASMIDAQQAKLAQQISGIRRTLGMTPTAGLVSPADARRILAKRKHEIPLIVLVLETLSTILPDHTYVTEFSVEGDKLRIVGKTQDAASLIKLIEQSGFTRATFFAPTTRSASPAGERFHIEATVHPFKRSGS
jgi:general secretion pathway protein L